MKQKITLFSLWLIPLLFLTACNKKELAENPPAAIASEDGIQPGYSISQQYIRFDAISNSSYDQTENIKVYQAVNGQQIDVTSRCWFTNIEVKDAGEYVEFYPYLPMAQMLRITFKNRGGFGLNYPYSYVTLSAVVMDGNTRVTEVYILLEKYPGDFPLDFPPEP